MVSRNTFAAALLGVAAPAWADADPTGLVPAPAGIVGVELEHEVVGWTLGAYAGWSTVSHGGPPLAPAAARLPGGARLETSGAAGMSDLDLAAERRLPLGKRLALALATTLRLPTGSVREGLGTGRTEALVDAGLALTLGRWELWSGGARRLRGRGEFNSGRDVWEVYAGAAGRIGKRASLRLEAEAREPAYRGGPPELSARLNLGRRLARGIRLGIAAGQEADEFGTHRVARLALRWQVQPR